MKSCKTNRLTVKRHPDGIVHHGLLTFGGRTIPCILGRSGITTRKREGDGATPAGCFSLLYGFYRHDRLGIQSSLLPLEPIGSKDGWCDEPKNPNYNAPVCLPFGDSHEIMKRDDRLYDVCIVLDYNIHPKSRGMGSAIFFHQTSVERKPTEGCVAIDPEHMRILLPLIAKHTKMIITP